MLEWKAARDKQRKIEAIKNKKDHGFVVKHVMHSPGKYLVAGSARIKMEGKQQQQADKPSRRITRSHTKHMTKIQNERKVDKKLTPSKIPAPVAKKGATPRSEERRPTRISARNKNRTKKEGNKNENCEDVNATKSTSVGFNFQFNSESAVPTKFNFCTETPVLKFSYAKVDFEDPATKFNALHQNAGKARSIQVSTGLKQPQMENVLQETIAGNSDNVFQSAIMEVPSNIAHAPYDDGFIATRSLRCTPRRAAKQMEQSGSSVKKEQAKEGQIRTEENIEEENEMKMFVAKGCPGKTPKRHHTLPKHMVQIMDEERFTPRRIQSTSHFRRLVAGEREKFDNMNAVWTTYLNENELQEEICGRIRTVIGQAQLLMDQRFKQFEELIALHQSNISEKGATATDLQGFWDMVDYQIEDVHKKFAELETWKNKNWEIEKPKKTTKVRKAVEKKTTKDTSKATAARQEATRKFKLAMRAKLQAAKSSSDADLGVQIVAGERKLEDETSMTSNPTTVLPVLEDNKQDHRDRSSSGEMSSDSLEGEKCQIKMLPLKDSSSFNIQLCSALEKIDLKNTEEDKESEGKENLSSPPRKSTLRRSIRRTPSMYKTSNKQDEASTNIADKKPQDVACNLFMDSTNTPEDNGLFAKYIRPSVADEKYDDLFGLGIQTPYFRSESQDNSLIKFD
eukprot:Seg895.4 transcript_id=Seg895.4/GoldUCD/mRNA.D3Y31 product="Disks large-associated protein 1" protein_id=Seg895.4/GoldUCD/D3Y31